MENGGFSWIDLIGGFEEICTLGCLSFCLAPVFYPVK